MARNDRTLWIGVGVALLVCSAAAWYAWREGAFERPGGASPATRPPAPAATPPAAAAAVQHPLAPAPDSPAALPPLADSDGFVREQLAGVFGEEALKKSFVPQNLVRRIVATVDNLGRERMAVELRPVVPVAGRFLVEGPEDTPNLDPRNFERYKPAVAALEALDTQRLVAAYRRLYPLLQGAYEDLGYPSAYFNDRLVAVIDDLLATPEVRGPIALRQPRVFYEFADPGLESRSAGQKLLLRMGPENAAVIRKKLHELRDAVSAAPPGGR